MRWLRSIGSSIATIAAIVAASMCWSAVLAVVRTTRIPIRRLGRLALRREHGDVEGTGRQFVLVVDRTSARLRRDVMVAGGVVLSEDAEPLVVAFAELVDAIGAARAVQRVVTDGTERPARLALVAGDVVRNAAGAYEGRAVSDGRALVRLATPAHLLVSDDAVRVLGSLAP